MKHKNETKIKLSKIRKEYLNKTNKKRWDNKSKYHTSIPCEKFKETLKERNIQFIEEFKPLLHKGRYFSIDVAFPDKMVGVEINGRQHYDCDGNLLPYYQNRHDLIESEGWKLYEIPYHCAFNKEKIDNLLECVKNQTPINEFDYKLYIPDKKIVKIKSAKIFTKYQYPSDVELIRLANNLTLKELSEHININKSALWSYLKFRKIKTKLTRQKTAKHLIPNKEEFQKLLSDYPLSILTLKFGVGMGTVKRYMKLYGLSKPKHGHWSKQQSTYENRVRKLQKTNRPDKGVLLNLINNGESFVSMGKQFNVSDNAVRKWCKFYNINCKLCKFSHNKMVGPAGVEPAIVS